MAKEKKTVTTRTPTRQMRRRALIAVILVVGLFFLADALKLAQLQLVQSEEWRNHAVSQQMSDTVVSAKRGTIYDANMQPLAESADVWKIIMSPKDIASLDWTKLKGVDTSRTLTEEQALEVKRQFIANGLAEMFSLDVEKVYKQTGKTSSQYEVIKS